MKFGIGFVFLLAVLFLTQFATAKYISGEVRIDEKGFATFDVKTDAEIKADGLEFKDEKLIGRTDFFTEKSGSTWTFSLEEGNYDDIFLDIKLPNTMQKITSIQGNKYLFDTEENILTLVDSGELNFEISYSIRERVNYNFIYYLIGIIVLAVVLFFVYKKKRKKDRLNDIMFLVNENEHKIIDLLMKGQMRQKAVREKLNLAKASFSRYVANLEKKKLITREGDGKNKILTLK